MYTNEKEKHNTATYSAGPLYTCILMKWYIYTVSTKKRPPERVQKSSKLSSVAQLQFNSMNICLFLIKLPILEKVSPIVIEILTFNKWSWKVYRFQKRDVDHVVERLVEEWSRFDHEINSAAVTQWPARLCACVKVDGGHFEHFLWQLMNDHTASLEITVGLNV